MLTAHSRLVPVLPGDYSTVPYAVLAWCFLSRQRALPLFYIQKWDVVVIGFK